MSQRHALASPDAWVELRDPLEFKARDKRAVLRAINSSTPSGVTLDLVDAVIALSIVNWQLPTPLPIPTAELLDKGEGDVGNILGLLEIVDYDRLCELVEDAQDVLFPKAVVPTKEQIEDPASPTEPSAA